MRGYDRVLTANVGHLLTIVNWFTAHFVSRCCQGSVQVSGNLNMGSRLAVNDIAESIFRRDSEGTVSMILLQQCPFLKANICQNSSAGMEQTRSACEVDVPLPTTSCQCSFGNRLLRLFGCNMEQWNGLQLAKACPTTLDFRPLPSISSHLEPTCSSVCPLCFLMARTSRLASNSSIDHDFLR